MSQPTISDFASEDRLFPPPPAFQAAALAGDDSLYREADADFEAFWARQARELLTWSSDFHTTLEWDLPDAKWFVGGKLNVSDNCLDRHVAAGRGDKVAFHWEGEPGDTRTITYADLLDEVQPLRQRAQGPRRREGRPGRHLHADDPRAAGRDARLRPHRRGPLGGLRRLLARLASSTASTTRGCKVRHHRRRRLPPRGAVAAQGQRRRGARRRARPSPAWSWCDRTRHRGRHDRGPRPLVPRPHGRRRRPTARPSRWTARTCSTSSTPRAPPPSPRASCTPPAATSPRSAFTHKYVFDLQARRPTSTGAPPTSAGSPATATSSTGRSPTAPRRCMYEGTPDTPGQGPVLGHHRALRRHQALHRAHRHPDVHEVGRPRSPRSTTCRRCGCSARSASPSTPRRGCGTTSTSAAAAARSSTPGGRPRPAAT